MINQILVVSSIAFVITFIFTPLTILLANKFGLVTNTAVRPHPAHTHKGVIPRAGGVPIFLGILISALYSLALTPSLIAILVGCTILVLVGLWDDLKDRSPYVRLLINIFVAIMVISSGVGIPYITNPLNGIIHLDKWGLTLDLFGEHSIILLSNVLALIWIVWVTNIVGWSGGIDGQLPGFVAISALVIGILSLRYSMQDLNQLYVTQLSFLTFGAFLGFLPWNYYPQKIMPGYGGKTLAGFLLAILSILSFSKLGTALLVLALPLTDAAFMLVKRVLKGKSPVKASAGHLHHHLLSLGWSKRKVALFYWIISAFAGIIALSLSSQQKVFATVFILVVIAGFIMFINVLKNIENSG